MMDLVLTAVNDTPMYRAYLMVMLESMRRNSPQTSVVATVYNWAADEARILRERYWPQHTVSAAEHPGMDGAAASHVRGVLLSEALSEPSGTLVSRLAWMDPDVIIRAPLAGLWEGVKPDTLRIMYRPWQDEKKRKFQDGVYVLGNGVKTRRLVNKLRQKLVGRREWYADQLELYRVWHKMGGAVKLLDLPRRWNDNQMHPDSAIWHANMKHKWSRWVFNAEWMHYYTWAVEHTGLLPWQVDFEENRVKGGA